MKIRPCPIKDAPADIDEVADYMRFVHSDSDGDAPIVSRDSKKLANALLEKMEGVDRDFFIGEANFDGEQFEGEYVIFKHTRLFDFFHDNKRTITAIGNKLIKARFGGIQKDFEDSMITTVYALLGGLPNLNKELIDENGDLVDKQIFTDYLLDKVVTKKEFDLLIVLALVHEVVSVISATYRAKQPLYPWEMVTA